MYESYAVGPFSGGLNLRDFPDQIEPTQAYDLSNVTFTERGGVKSRPGYENVLTGLAARPDNFEPFNTGSAWQLAISAGSRIEVRNTAGAIVGTPLTSGVNAYPNYFTRFGGGTAALATPHLYASNGTDQVRKWTGAGTWSTPTWSLTNSAPNPTGMFGAVTPWDSRLVLARFPNTAGGDNPSSVRFSATADPESWDGYEYVDLTPGDGEKIMGMAAYGNYVVVFKESKFFVFYGTTFSASNDLGVPDFEFRTVDTGVGLTAKQGLCVAPDGIYFLNNKGLYRTDGGSPVLVSSLIEPLFTGETRSGYGGSTINFTAIDAARLTFHKQQVYVAVPTGTSTVNNALMVFDPRYGWWTVWAVGAGALASFEWSVSTPKLTFGLASGSVNVCRFDESLTTDAGSGFQARIKMGFTDLGVPIAKTVRESQVWGSGAVRFAVARDLRGSRSTSALSFAAGVDKWGDGSPGQSDVWADGTDATDTWSAGVTADFALARQAVRGQIHGIEVYSADVVTPEAWSVNRVIFRVREQRVATVTKVDKES
jgi:hypothetical protein